MYKRYSPTLFSRLRKQALTLTTIGLLLLSHQGHAKADSFEQEWDELWQDEALEPLIHGFLEQGLGFRLVDTELNHDISLLDTRLRLELDHNWQRWRFSAKGDIYYDGVLSGFREQIRELTSGTSAGSFDIKVGRQILTWGTGDYLFLNDLFAKDWQSFFSGREDQYLKAPSNSLKVSYFHTWFNTDLVWTPEFTADNYINGDYFSFYDRNTRQRIAPGFTADQPSDGEIALRLHKAVGRTEFALYAYDGFFKSPNAINNRGLFTFARLQSFGASARQPVSKGLLNLESSYYQSIDDKKGAKPLVGNSQWRFLIGYEQELVTRLTASAQLYLERILNYKALIEHSPDPATEPEENRTLVTTRLNWRSSNDKLSLVLFVFYSPSDRDSYTRASANYRFNDHWQADAGINWFSGQQPFTFFGQFEENNNVYGRVRYRF